MKDMQADMKSGLHVFNQFQTLSERFGKEQGNAILRALAEKAKRIFHGFGGIICREGWDSFLAYCPHRGDYQTILDQLSSGLTEDPNLRVRIRIGVYAETDKRIEMERRFERARIAADSANNYFTSSLSLYDSTLQETEAFTHQLLDDFHRSLEVRGIFRLLSAEVQRDRGEARAQQRGSTGPVEAQDLRDALTGVKSKHAYMETEAELNLKIASGDQSLTFGVAVCDVNGLKQVNDTLGHKAGDRFIQDASRMICDIFKHSPIYRIGGDEFVIVMTGKGTTSCFFCVGRRLPASRRIPPFFPLRSILFRIPGLDPRGDRIRCRSTLSPDPSCHRPHSPAGSLPWLRRTWGMVPASHIACIHSAASFRSFPRHAADRESPHGRWGRSAVPAGCDPPRSARLPGSGPRQQEFLLPPAPFELPESQFPFHPCCKFAFPINHKYSSSCQV